MFYIIAQFVFKLKYLKEFLTRKHAVNYFMTQYLPNKQLFFYSRSLLISLQTAVKPGIFMLLITPECSDSFHFSGQNTFISPPPFHFFVYA